MKKIIEKFKNHKKLVMIVLIALIIITPVIVFAISNTAPKEEKEIVVLKLKGKKYIKIDVNTEFKDPGIKVLVNDIESKMEYKTKGKVNVSKPGDYVITYSVDKKKINRTVTVIDNIAPTLTLDGAENHIVLQGEEYKEPGFTALDNIDGDITNKVTVEGDIDNNTEGEYQLTYKVSDSSNNELTVTRLITVQKKLTVKQAPIEIKEEAKIIKTSNREEINDMNWNASGINVVVHSSTELKNLFLLDIGTNQTYPFAVTRSGENYSSDLNLNNVPNGVYDLYLQKEESEKAINQLNLIYKINRAKINNKLVTMIYSNNNVRVHIENFVYQYDILMDVGHGGGDPGAVNVYMREKDLNLEISKYEKQRYEAHGLKVLMNRNGDTPELFMGDSSWVELTRRSYALGYYGAVSRVVYSNHHNSSTNKGLTDYEILVPSALSKSELQTEHNIMAAWNGMYRLTENHLRFYTRNYDNSQVNSKANGEVYSYKNYYAILRIPYTLFNTKSVIYEGCYMSNLDNFNWYYYEHNWKKISEAKIKAYVEAIKGVGSYIPVS